MATKEVLNCIFEEALQAPEESFNTPAPSKIPATAVAAAPAAEPAKVSSSASAFTTEISDDEEVKAHASVNETDPEFGALLEEREGRIKKKSSRARWAVNLLFLGLFGGTATAFAVSPELRGNAEHFVGSLKEGVEDVKMMGNGTENYDEALEQIAARGDQINNETFMMGVDPSTVDAGDDPNMLAEMNQLAGEDLGVDKRFGKLQTLGEIGQTVTGVDGPKVGRDKDAARTSTE